MTAAELVSWWWYVIRYECRETWQSMPGPWPVKVVTLAVLLAVPGQLDEVIFFAVLGALRKRQARRALAQSS